MVLREVKGGYQFQGNLRDYLARQGAAALAEHRKLIVARLAAPWVRRAVIPGLTRAAIKRVMWDAAVGAGVATVILGIAILRFYGNLGHWGWILVLPAAAMAGIAGVISFSGLRLAAWLARLAVAYLPGWPRDVRVFTVADAVVIAALLVAFEGSALAAALAFCLPLALVAGCGGWACALALRRTRDSIRRWLHLAPDLIAVATTAALLLVLVHRGLLTTVPAAWPVVPGRRLGHRQALARDGGLTPAGGQGGREPGGLAAARRRAGAAAGLARQRAPLLRARCRRTALVA